MSRKDGSARRLALPYLAYDQAVLENPMGRANRLGEPLRLIRWLFRAGKQNLSRTLGLNLPVESGSRL